MKNIKTALLSAVVAGGLSLGSATVAAEQVQPSLDAKSGVETTRMHHIADASKHKAGQGVIKVQRDNVTKPSSTRLHHIADASAHKQTSRKTAQRYIAKQYVASNRLHHIVDASAHKQVIN